MNILTKLNLDYVVFQFVYQKNIETHVPVLLETGEKFKKSAIEKVQKKTEEELIKKIK